MVASSSSVHKVFGSKSCPGLTSGSVCLGMDVHGVIDDVELDDYTVTEAAARVKFRMRHKHGLRARPKSPVGTIQLPKPCTPKS